MATLASRAGFLKPFIADVSALRRDRPRGKVRASSHASCPASGWLGTGFCFLFAHSTLSKTSTDCRYGVAHGGVRQADPEQQRGMTLRCQIGK